MDGYTEYLNNLKKLYDSAKHLKPACENRLDTAKAENLCAIFAPHPDDECIIGGLPIRLVEESNWAVTNIPVSFGSNEKRQEEREKELKTACECLGVSVDPILGKKFPLRPEIAVSESQKWQDAVAKIAQHIIEKTPKLLVYPHANDRHAAHIATHQLLVAAIERSGYTGLIVETEFWAELPKPNLMVELSEHTVAKIVNALAHHKGEVQRNPYHIRLPMKMMDDVRRGSEIIGGAGAGASDYTFATLYHLKNYVAGKQLGEEIEGLTIPANESASDALLACLDT